MLRRTLAVGIAGAALMLGVAVPAFADTPPAPQAPYHTNDIAKLCNLGAYGDLTYTCDLRNLTDLKQYCNYGILGDFRPTCDPANLADPGRLLNLGTYGDYSGLLKLDGIG